MIPNFWFYQLLLEALIVLGLLMHVWWPDKPAAASQLPLAPNKRRRTRATAPKPFTGLIHQPLCAAWQPGTEPHPQAALGSPPPFIPFSRGRRRTVDMLAMHTYAEDTPWRASPGRRGSAVQRCAKH